jgi:hypothetical protein
MNISANRKIYTYGNIMEDFKILGEAEQRDSVVLENVTAPIIIDEKFEGYLLNLLLSDTHDIKFSIKKVKLFTDIIRSIPGTVSNQSVTRDEDHQTNMPFNIYKIVACKSITYDDLYKDDVSEIRQYMPLSQFLQNWETLAKSKDILARTRIAAAFKPFFPDRSDESLSSQYLVKDEHCYCKYKGMPDDELFLKRCLGLPDPDEVVIPGYVILKNNSLHRKLSNIPVFDVDKYIDAILQLKQGNTVKVIKADGSITDGLLKQVSNKVITVEIRQESDYIFDFDIKNLNNNENFIYPKYWTDEQVLFYKGLIYNQTIACLSSKQSDNLPKMLTPSIDDFITLKSNEINTNYITNYSELSDWLKIYGFDIEKLKTNEYKSLFEHVKNVVDQLKNDTIKSSINELPVKIISKTNELNNINFYNNFTKQNNDLGYLEYKFEGKSIDSEYERFSFLSRSPDYGIVYVLSNLLSHVSKTVDESDKTTIEKHINDISNKKIKLPETPKPDLGQMPNISDRPFDIGDLYKSAEMGKFSEGTEVTIYQFPNSKNFQLSKGGIWMQKNPKMTVDPFFKDAMQFETDINALDIKKEIIQNKKTLQENIKNKIINLEKHLQAKSDKLEVPRKTTFISKERVDLIADMSEEDITNFMDNPLYYKVLDDEDSIIQQDTTKEEHVNFNAEYASEFLEASLIGLSQDGYNFLCNNLEFYNGIDALRSDLQKELQKILATQKAIEEKLSDTKTTLLQSKIKTKLEEKKEELVWDHKKKSLLITAAILSILMTISSNFITSNLLTLNPKCVMEAKNKTKDDPLQSSIYYMSCIAVTQIKLSDEDTKSTESMIRDYIDLILSDKEYLEKQIKEAKLEALEIFKQDNLTANTKTKKDIGDINKYITLFNDRVITDKKISVNDNKKGIAYDIINSEILKKIINNIPSVDDQDTIAPTCLLKTKHVETKNIKTNEILIGQYEIIALSGETSQETKYPSPPEILTCISKPESHGEEKWLNILDNETQSALSVVKARMSNAGISNFKIFSDIMENIPAQSLYLFYKTNVVGIMSKIAFDYRIDHSNIRNKVFLDRDIKITLSKIIDNEAETILLSEIRKLSLNRLESFKNYLKHIIQASCVSGKEWMDYIIKKDINILHQISTSLITRTILAVSNITDGNKTYAIEKMCSTIIDPMQQIHEQLLKAKNALFMYFMNQLVIKSNLSHIDIDTIKISKQQARIERDEDITKKMDVMDNELRSQITQMKQMGYEEWRNLVEEVTPEELDELGRDEIDDQFQDDSTSEKPQVSKEDEEAYEDNDNDDVFDDNDNDG